MTTSSVYRYPPWWELSSTAHLQPRSHQYRLSGFVLPAPCLYINGTAFTAPNGSPSYWSQKAKWPASKSTTESCSPTFHARLVAGLCPQIFPLVPVHPGYGPITLFNCHRGTATELLRLRLVTADTTRPVPKPDSRLRASGKRMPTLGTDDTLPASQDPVSDDVADRNNVLRRQILQPARFDLRALLREMVSVPRGPAPNENISLTISVT